MSTSSKIVEFPTVRSKHQSRKAKQVKIDLLQSLADHSLAEVSRLCWEDPEVAARLTEAMTIGERPHVS